MLLLIEQGVDRQLQPDGIFHVKLAVGLVIDDMHFIIKMLDGIDKSPHRIII